MGSCFKILSDIFTEEMTWLEKKSFVARLRLKLYVVTDLRAHDVCACWGLLSTDDPCQRLDFYFNLIHPWWLQVKAIRTSLKPLDGFFVALLLVIFHYFQEKPISQLPLVKFDLNLVPE